MKLAAMGRLTASIAHEVRNPLSAINQAAQLLEEDGAVAPDGRAAARHDPQQREAHRPHRRRGAAAQPPRPPAARRSSPLGEFMRSLIDEIVQAENMPPGGVDHADSRRPPRHLRPRPPEPDRLEPRAQRVAALPEEGRQHPHRRARRLHGRCGNLRAGGRRPGHSRPSCAPQIFEPFFTTRPGGTGLGLYIARELADANGAALELLPKGPGAHFRMTLKRAVDAVNARQTVRSEESNMSRRIRGQPKVLVVDDEPDLLELLELTLSRMGLDTTRAETVAEAIRLLDKRAVRPLPHRHAAARRRGPARRRAHQPEGPRRAGRGDHRLRQRRERGGRAQGRRVRLPGEAGRARAAARAGQAGAEGPREGAAAEQLPAPRRIAGDAAGARHDRAPRQEPGAGVHQRRVRQRQGARRAHDPPRRPARRAAVRRRQLRRDSREPDGERVLRLSQGRVHRRRSRSRRILPGRQRRHAVPRRSRRPAAARCR